MKAYYYFVKQAFLMIVFNKTSHERKQKISTEVIKEGRDIREENNERLLRKQRGLWLWGLTSHRIMEGSASYSFTLDTTSCDKVCQ